jgi:hypothetical protein
VNFSLAAALLSSSFGFSVKTCMRGEKFVSKYVALAVRKADFSASAVAGEMRLRIMSSAGSSRRFCLRYEILLRRKVERNGGRLLREIAFKLEMVVVTISSVRVMDHLSRKRRV